ncbi:META domain-containing protein [Camelimonas abortus]|uniref:META domain-containing protein n=1 Tax=Camelimonas abortus TaxID=1017184 RepID=A0ABV7LFH7_9HYPH
MAPAHAQQATRTAPLQPRKIEKNFPLGKNWIAVSLNGKRYTGAERPSFVLDSQFRARGFGGCNTFSAVAFPLRDQGIAVGPLALTRRACDRHVQAAETAFLTALRYAQKWDLVGGQLVLKGPAGELRFDRTF